MAVLLNLVRPTMNVVKEYNTLLASLSFAEDFSQRMAVREKMDALRSKWDWSNILFKNEKTGKMGVKDVSGKELVAAEYDEVDNIGEYESLMNTSHTVAVRDGSKWGLIFADATGNFACDTIFDHLEWIPNTEVYIAKWGGKADTVGIVNFMGAVVVPNILTRVGDVTKGVILIEKDGKVGAVTSDGSEVVMPKYDSWTIDKNYDVLFKSGRTLGYVSTKTGIFVPRSLFRRRDYIGLSNFLMAQEF